MKAIVFNVLLSVGVSGGSGTPVNEAYIYETDDDSRVRIAKTYETDDDSVIGNILIENI